MISTTLVSALILFMPSCKKVRDIRGEWRMENTYDRGTFTSRLEFNGAEPNSGSVVVDSYSSGTYEVTGDNITFFNSFEHDELGLITKTYSGTFQGNDKMSGTGSVFYHAEDREEPLSWNATRL